MKENETRIESDSLGEALLPAQALYGIRTWRCLENMSFSGKKLSSYPSLIRALVLVKKAAAVANHHCGILDERTRAAIAAACDEIRDGKHVEHFIVDVYAGGGSIAINSNVNEVIANLANEKLGGKRGEYAPVDPKKHVNASQSTADACHSALHLAILFDWSNLDRELRRLVETAWNKSFEMKDVEIIARTCMQAAMIAPLGDSFSAFGAMLKRRREDLGASVDKLRSLNLGGTVIGTGEGAPEEYRRIIMTVLRHVAELDVEMGQNLVDAAQNIDVLAGVASSLTLLSGSLIKMAKDLRLMAAGPNAGFGEIVLPAVQEGSSFFKGKINPVVPETLIQCCFLVMGAEQTVRAALEHGELNLNVFEGAAGIAVLDAVAALTGALRLFHDRCFAGIVANHDRSALYEETLAQFRANAVKAKLTVAG